MTEPAYVCGKGEAGLNGGPNGDLYIDLNVKRDKYFVRDGDNLTTTVNIPMVAAVLGTTVPLETFDGVQEITIPEGAQSDSKTNLNRQHSLYPKCSENPSTVR